MWKMTTLLMMMMTTTAAAAAGAAAANIAASTAADAPDAQHSHDEGGGVEVVSIYKWQIAIGQEDKFRALEGFINLTHTLLPEALYLVAGEDQGILPYALDLGMSLPLKDAAYLRSYDYSDTRLNLLHKYIDPFVQERHTVVYENEKVRVGKPAPGTLRHVCIYEFKNEVIEERKMDVLLDMQDMLERAPGMMDFSLGLDIWKEEEGEVAPQMVAEARSEKQEYRAMGLQADFANKEEFDKFFAHAPRLEMMQLLNPLLSYRSCVDFLVPHEQVVVGDIPKTAEEAPAVVAEDDVIAIAGSATSGGGEGGGGGGEGVHKEEKRDVGAESGEHHRFLRRRGA